MSAFSYIASREISAGHTLGAQYDIDVVLQSVSDSDRPVAREHVAMSGMRETWLSRIEKTHKVKTIPLRESDPVVSHIREMLASTAAGEAVIVDLWGSVASPDSPVSMAIQPVGRSITRIPHLRFIQFSFTLRVL